METELVSQALASELIGLFIRRLEEFQDTYRLDVPILARLRKM
jgi:hypothetical protein